MKTVIVTGHLLLADARGRSREMRAELLAKNLLAFGRPRDRTGAFDPAHPTLVETADAQSCPQRTGQMRTPFAPIETRPAKHATRVLILACGQGFNIDADLTEKLHPQFRHHAGVGLKLHIAAAAHRVLGR